MTSQAADRIENAGRTLTWPIAKRRGKLYVVVASVVVALVVSGGSAFAYFRSSGSGTGSASTGAAVNVTVSAATAANDLFPGHSGTVSFKLKNTNPFTANFTSVTAASVTSGNESTCSASNITIAALPYSISRITVTSGQTTSATSVSGLVSMSGSAPTSCQGVSFTVSLTLSGQSN